jgi:hypothetical protein
MLADEVLIHGGTHPAFACSLFLPLFEIGKTISFGYSRTRGLEPATSAIVAKPNRQLRKYNGLPTSTPLPLWHNSWFVDHDAAMGDEKEVGTGRRPRRWRTVAEKRRIAELTFEPGASVALARIVCIRSAIRCSPVRRPYFPHITSPLV